MLHCFSSGPIDSGTNGLFTALVRQNLCDNRVLRGCGDRALAPNSTGNAPTCRRGIQHPRKHCQRAPADEAERLPHQTLRGIAGACLPGTARGDGARGYTRR